MDKIWKLIRQLNSPDVEARKHAAELLVEIGDESVVRPLLENLMCEGVDVLLIYNVLIKIGTPAVPALLEALKSYFWDLRSQSAWILGEIGDASAVPALIEALKNETEYGQRNPAEALGKIIQKCNSIELIDKIQNKVTETYAALQGRSKKGHDHVEIRLAKLMIEIAVKRNSLTPDKDILLDDHPKPPKKGGKIYQQLRAIRNK